MPRIDSDLLIDAPADLLPALEKLQTWINKKKHVRFIEPGRVLREIGDPDLVKLIRALLYLQENDFLRQVYRVKAPNGTILEDDYDSPVQIPKSIFTQFRKGQIKQGQADIVTGFVVEGHDDEG